MNPGSVLVPLALLLTLWFVSFTGVLGQRNSYLGLWGSVFDTIPDAVIDDLADRVDSEVYDEGGDEGEGGGESSGVGEDRARRGGSTSGGWSSLRELIHQRREDRRMQFGFGGNLTEMIDEMSTIMTNLNLPIHGNVLEGSSPNISDAISDHARTLDLKNLGATDTSKIASLAILQGWMLKQLTASPGGRSASLASNAASHVGHSTFRQLGVVLPPESHFTPSLCFVMQNFGNSGGYYDAWTGFGPICDVRYREDGAMFAWKEESMLTVDCHLQDRVHTAGSGDGDGGSAKDDGAKGDNAAEGIYSVDYSDQFSSSFGTMAVSNPLMNALSTSSRCLVSVASSRPGSSLHGTGTVMAMSTVNRAFAQIKPNSIKIEVCNRYVHILSKEE